MFVTPIVTFGERFDLVLPAYQKRGKCLVNSDSIDVLRYMLQVTFFVVWFGEVQDALAPTFGCWGWGKPILAGNAQRREFSLWVLFSWSLSFFIYFKLDSVTEEHICLCSFYIICGTGLGIWIRQSRSLHARNGLGPVARSPRRKGTSRTRTSVSVYVLDINAVSCKSCDRFLLIEVMVVSLKVAALKNDRKKMILADDKLEVHQGR